jgi:hypothetical protein
MALIETFTESLDDFSQWDSLGESNVVKTADGDKFSFETTDIDSTIILTSVDTFSLTGSWVSVVAENWWTTNPSGSFLQGGIGPLKGDFSSYAVSIFRHFPNTDVLEGTFVDPANGDPDSNAYYFEPTVVHTPIVFGMTFTDTEYTPWISLDLGATWESGSPVTYSAGSGDDTDWKIYLESSKNTPDLPTVLYYDFNVYEPGAVSEPALTEVYADTLVSEWNVSSIVDKTLTSAWNQGSAYLRHSTRHLHKTLFDYLNTQLTELGWTVDGNVPFGAPPVIMQDVLPEEWDEESLLEPGTLALTVGDEDAAANQELGGPLAAIEVPFFVDCFMDTPGTSLALALDVRDIFCGRVPGSKRVLNVTNYNNSPATQALGYTVEFEDVIRQNVRKNWEVVKLTAVMYFPDSEGN